MTVEEPGLGTIKETGDAISAPPAPGMVHELRVETNDPTVRIVVVDDRFEAVAKAAGSIVAKLPAGVYKVRAQRGASSIGFEDKLVILDRDTQISIAPPQFVCAAPIGGTRASEAHVAAREWLDGVVHASVGQGSKIAVLARYAAPARGGAPLHPFRGLYLLRADARPLVDLEQAAPKRHAQHTGDAIAICGIQVDPGPYILQHHLSSSRKLSQSVIATGGWQVTISIRRPQEGADPAAGTVAHVPTSGAETENGLFYRPGYVSLLMRRLINGQAAQHAAMRPSNDGFIDDDWLAEVARQGLAEGVQYLSDGLYDLLLRDFENPMVGIIGGLLLDLEREAKGAQFAPAHTALFDVAVRKLRTMVGSEHPDVEALSFRCQDSSLASRRAINARPMFYRSWRIILEAAARRQNLVPLDLWRKTIASSIMPPYLVWSSDQAGRQARLRQLRKTASVLSTLPTALPSASLESVVSPTSDAGVTSPSSATDRPKAGSTGAPPASAAYKPKTTRISREEIALEMGVPANALSHLIAWPKLGTMVTKASEKSGARTAGTIAAAKKVTAKSATSGTAKSDAKKAGAMRAGPAGVKAVAKKAAAAKKKGRGSVGGSAAPKAKAGAKSARRSSRRKSTRG